MYQISEFQLTNAEDIARLHQEYLNTPFKGNSGRHLLVNYYKTLFFQKGGVCFVVIFEDSVIGFVCGIWDPRLISKYLLRKFWYSMIYWGILHLLTFPKMIIDISSRIFQKNSNKEKKPGNNYELRPIVVANEYQGKNVSNILLSKLCEDAKKRSFEKIILFTENDNLPAQKFYKKNNFQLIKQVDGEKILFELDLSFNEC